MIQFMLLYKLASTCCILLGVYYNRLVSSK